MGVEEIVITGENNNRTHLIRPYTGSFFLERHYNPKPEERRQQIVTDTPENMDYETTLSFARIYTGTLELSSRNARTVLSELFSQTENLPGVTYAKTDVIEFIQEYIKDPEYTTDHDGTDDSDLEDC